MSNSSSWYWDWWQPPATLKGGGGSEAAAGRTASARQRPCQKNIQLRPKPWPPNDSNPDPTKWMPFEQIERDAAGNEIARGYYWVSCDNPACKKCHMYFLDVTLPNGNTIRDFKCKEVK